MAVANAEDQENNEDGEDEMDKKAKQLDEAKTKRKIK